MRERADEICHEFANKTNIERGADRSFITQINFDQTFRNVDHVFYLHNWCCWIGLLWSDLFLHSGINIKILDAHSET